MALRKIKGEKRDGFINLRIPTELMMENINIIAFLDNISGVDVVIRAIQELSQREAQRIDIVKAAVKATREDIIPPPQ